MRVPRQHYILAAQLNSEKGFDVPDTTFLSLMSPVIDQSIGMKRFSCHIQMKLNIDSYLMFAASAIAGNTLLRSLCGFAFPMFATQMYNGMYMAEICMRQFNR
jgi:hypothetical protein